jgi:hypothetical protein
MVPFNSAIERFIARRKQRIRHDLYNPGKFYPRAEFEAALKFWNIAV